MPTDLSFAHPGGLWALLGIPVVLLIHFLQRRSQVVVITTLFLLENMRRESAVGRKFEKLRSSIPLWLQLLMVLLLAWLLVEPRWRRENSVQRVAVVLDGSASMEAFREKAETEVRAVAQRLARGARTTEFSLLSTTPGAPAFYHGTVVDEMVSSLKDWHPLMGGHDFTPALRTGRSLVGDQGTVLLLTDRPTQSEPAFGAKLLAFGLPKENAGFAGLTFVEEAGQTLWKVLVRNYGKTPQARDWWLEAGTTKTKSEHLVLEPGQSRTLQGAFPTGLTQAALVMTGDALPVDDRLPVVKPEPKTLRYLLPVVGGPQGKTLEQLFASFDHVVRADTPSGADLMVDVYSPLAPKLPDGAACIFADDPQPGANYLGGTILVEEDPLVSGLNWQSLLVRETLGIPRQKSDRVLIWQGEVPLVSLRLTAASQPQLLFNFDLQSSNARKLPAFVVLLHRHLEQLRAAKPAPETANFETGQKMAVAHVTGEKAPPLQLRFTDEAGKPAKQDIPLAQAAVLHAPVAPGFFEIWQGESRLLTAAAHFADARESDLSTAASQDDLAGLEAKLVETHSEADANWRVWVLILLAALLASWWWARGVKNSDPDLDLRTAKQG